MKILYVCSDPGIKLDRYGGSAAHIRGTIGAFGKLGHSVSALVSAADGDAGLAIPVHVIMRAQVMQNLPEGADFQTAAAVRHLMNNVCLEQALRHLIEREPPDLIYERCSPSSAACGLLARAQKIPHVLEVNALLSEEGHTFRKLPLREAASLMETAAFDAAALLVTVSGGLRDALLTKGVPEEKILVVPNGVDTERFTPEGAVRRQGLENKIVLGFSGTMKKWHAVDTLAGAFRRLAAEDPRYHLLAVGAGPLSGMLEELRAAYPDRVTLTGAVPHEEVPALVRAMDIALAPYPAMEGFYFSPLKIGEYMACGRAVVSVSLGPIRDVIEDGATGLLAVPGDEEDLAAKVRRLVGDPGLRDSLGKAAAARARCRGWEQGASEILARMRSLGILSDQAPDRQRSDGGGEDLKKAGPRNIGGDSWL